MSEDMTLADFLRLSADEQQRRAGRRRTPSAPMRPSWVDALPPRPQRRAAARPDFPFPTPYDAPAPPAPAPRVNFSALANAEMGAFDNFADWHQAQQGLERRLGPPSLEVMPMAEPWRQPPVEQIGRRVTPLAPGSPAPRRGLEPNSAEGATRTDDLDAAWNAALGRARSSWAEQTARDIQVVPRPGRPAISFLRWGRTRENDPPRRR